MTLEDWYAAQRRWPHLPPAPLHVSVSPNRAVAAAPCVLEATVSATADLAAGEVFYFELPHGWHKFLGRIYPSRGVAVRGHPGVFAPGMGLLVDICGPALEPWHHHGQLLDLDRFWLIAVAIPRGGLRAGQAFRIVIGAPPGCPLRAQKWSQRAVFASGLRRADGAVLPVRPQPAVEVVGGPPAHLSVHAPATVAPGEDFPVHLHARDAAYWNPAAADCLVELRAEGALQAPLTARLRAGHASVPCRMDRGVGWLSAWSPQLGICGRSGPVAAGILPDGLRIFFGDLHGQVYDSIGAGSHDEYFRWARDVERLDFCAPANHYGGRRRADSCTWRRCVETTNRYNAPDRFVTIVGYEWGGGEGHRNVYFRDAHPPLILPRGLTDPGADTLAELTAMLQQSSKEFLLIPHHPNFCCPVDWSYRDDTRQRLVEICSQWGISEEGGRHSVNAALAMGHRLGFVGGSDTHFGTPGRGGHGDGQLCGLTAVVAPRLTRQAVYDALCARRCYAVFGERMFIALDVAGCTMGSQIAAPPGSELWGRRRVSARVATTTPIETVEIVRNGQTVARDGGAKYVELSFDDDEPLPDVALAPDGRGAFCYYYLRVRTASGHFGWSSPVWVVAGS